METKTGNKMRIGSTVRVAFYSVSAGGIVYGDTGTVVERIGKNVYVNFGGNVKKFSVFNLVVV